MNTSSGIVKKINTTWGSCHISCENGLTGSEAILIRKEILNCISEGYNTIYLDTIKVNKADLSGINEVIHTSYLFANTNTRFILIYRKNSQIEKWVATTKLDKFVKTTVISAA